MGQAWFVVDTTDSSAKVRVDQLVVDATYVSQDNAVVEGYILAAHGIDFEIASRLDRPILNQLGLAANLRSVPPPPRRGSGLSRVRLLESGRIAAA